MQTELISKITNEKKDKASEKIVHIWSKPNYGFILGLLSIDFLK